MAIEASTLSPHQSSPSGSHAAAPPVVTWVAPPSSTASVVLSKTWTRIDAPIPPLPPSAPNGLTSDVMPLIALSLPVFPSFTCSMALAPPAMLRLRPATPTTLMRFISVVATISTRCFPPRKRGAVPGLPSVASAESSTPFSLAPSFTRASATLV